MALHEGQSTSFEDEIYFSSSNPLRNYVGQCTWYCWSKANSKAKAYPDRNLKVDKLSTSAAGKWATDAQANGYTIGDTPKKDSIAVWATSSDTEGHVAYVEDYDPNTGEVCFSEANWYKNRTISGNLYVDAKYVDNIKKNVAAYNKNIVVASQNPYGENGIDGKFNNMSLSSFKDRKKSKGCSCKFIYLSSN